MAINHTWLYVATICFATTATIIAAASRRRRSATPENDASQVRFVADHRSETNDPETKLIAQNEASPLKMNAFKPIIKSFRGQIGAVWKLARECDSLEIATAMFDNLDAVVTSNSAADDNGTITQWNDFTADRTAWSCDDYSRKAAELLTLFKECGVKLSLEKSVRWNPETERHYLILGAATEGQVCDVVIPCAILDDKIFEQGIVTPRINDK